MLELDFELPPPLPPAGVLLLYLPPPTGLGVGEPVEQLLEVSLLEEGVNAGPVSPIKSTIFPTVQEFENDQYDTLDIQGVVHCDEFFTSGKDKLLCLDFWYQGPEGTDIF